MKTDQFANVIKRWKSLENVKPSLLMILVFFLITFVITWKIGIWEMFLPKEECYEALEKIAYDIAETKEIIQPITDDLAGYKVSFNLDGTMFIKLYGHHTEVVFVELFENYEICGIGRSILDTLEMIFVLVVVHLGISLLLWWVIWYWVYKILKYIYFKTHFEDEPSITL